MHPHNRGRTTSQFDKHLGTFSQIWSKTSMPSATFLRVRSISDCNFRLAPIRASNLYQAHKRASAPSCKMLRHLVESVPCSTDQVAERNPLNELLAEAIGQQLCACTQAPSRHPAADRRHRVGLRGCALCLNRCMSRGYTDATASGRGAAGNAHSSTPRMGMGTDLGLHAV